MRRPLRILFVNILLSVPIETKHFYGGTVTWKPMNNSASQNIVDVMFIQSYQWKRSWTSGSSSGFCNRSTILNQWPKIPASNDTLKCVTTACGAFQDIPIDEYCTDFSTLVDSSSGQIFNIQYFDVGTQFCVAFQDSAWARVLSTDCGSSGKKRRHLVKRATNSTPLCFSTGARWSIGSCLDLHRRPEGIINTPPVATVISPVKVQINSIINVRIPVIDYDSDFLRCRWAQKTATFDECGDVCQTTPGATLNPNDCSITFNSTGTTIGDFFAITLMVEDFSDANSTVSFSSVPIQFLIYVVGTTACAVKPTINSSLSQCSIVEVGVQFNFTLVIQQGCPSTTLKDVFTMPPLYMYKGSITPGPTNTSWTVSETWIPSSLQLGSQVFCALATDSGNIQSDQYCLTFTVVPAGSKSKCPMATTIATTIQMISTTSEAKTENPFWLPLIIALSILGCLGLLASCCCGWCLWLKGASGRTHQRRRSYEPSLNGIYQPKKKPLSPCIHPLRPTSTIFNQNDTSKSDFISSTVTFNERGPSRVASVGVRRIYPIDLPSRQDSDFDEISIANTSKSSVQSTKPIIVQVHSAQDESIPSSTRRRNSIHVKVGKQSRRSKRSGSSSKKSIRVRLFS